MRLALGPAVRIRGARGSGGEGDHIPLLTHPRANNTGARGEGEGWGRPRRSHEPPPSRAIAERGSFHRQGGGEGHGRGHRPFGAAGGGSFVAPPPPQLVGGRTTDPAVTPPAGAAAPGPLGPPRGGRQARAVCAPAPLGSLFPRFWEVWNHSHWGLGGGKLESNLVQSFCCRCCAMHVFSDFGRLEPPFPLWVKPISN